MSHDRGGRILLAGCESSGTALAPPAHSQRRKCGNIIIRTSHGAGETVPGRDKATPAAPDTPQQQQGKKQNSSPKLSCVQHLPHGDCPSPNREREEKGLDKGKRGRKKSLTQIKSQFLQAGNKLHTPPASPPSSFLCGRRCSTKDTLSPTQEHGLGCSFLQS